MGFWLGLLILSRNFASNLAVKWQFCNFACKIMNCRWNAWPKLRSNNIFVTCDIMIFFLVNKSRQSTCMCTSFLLGCPPIAVYEATVICLWDFTLPVQREYNTDASFWMNFCFRLRDKGFFFDCVWSMACLGRVLFLQRLIILCIRLLWTGKWLCWCSKWARSRLELYLPVY